MTWLTKLSGTREGASVSKKLTSLAIRVLLVLQTFLLLYSVIPVFYTSDSRWVFYVNSKGGQIWLCMSAVLAVVWLLDAATPGHTIMSILELHDDATWQEKAVAAFFLVGIGYICAIAIGSMVGV